MNELVTNGDGLFPEPRNLAQQESMPSDPAAVAAAERAAKNLQLAYFMATQRPRDEHDAWQRIMQACKRPSFAESAIYNKPVGGKTISGPSVRLAEAIVRSWGNILIQTAVVFEDDHRRRVSVQVIDLETNNQYTKDIVTNKTVERKFAKDREVIGQRENSNGDTVYIVKATEDELHNKEAALISKAIRNEGLRLIPSDVVEDAIGQCTRTMRDADARDPEDAIKQIVYAFGESGVTAKDLESYLGCPLSQATHDDRMKLRAIRRAIRDGETTWRAVVEQKEGAEPGAATREKADHVQQALRDRLDEASGSENRIGMDDEPDDFEAMSKADLDTYMDHCTNKIVLSSEMIDRVKLARPAKATRDEKADVCRLLAAEMAKSND